MFTAVTSSQRGKSGLSFHHSLNFWGKNNILPKVGGAQALISVHTTDHVGVFFMEFHFMGNPPPSPKCVKPNELNTYWHSSAVAPVSASTPQPITLNLN